MSNEVLAAIMLACASNLMGAVEGAMLAVGARDRETRRKGVEMVNEARRNLVELGDGYLRAHGEELGEDHGDKQPVRGAE